jgi:baculoviral IAP repeat-containing protein 6
LGTWSGGAGEGWDSSVSTFLQVLVSIQSLILVPEPYFNEPGYEKSLGTPAGKASSKEYNQIIRDGCIRFAMIDHLENPKQGFEEIIRIHFLLKKDVIKAQVLQWVADSHCQKMQPLADRLFELLDKL